MAPTQTKRLKYQKMLQLPRFVTRTISEGLALMAFNPETAKRITNAMTDKWLLYQVIKLQTLFVIQALMALKSKQATSWGCRWQDFINVRTVGKQLLRQSMGMINDDSKSNNHLW